MLSTKDASDTTTLMNKRQNDGHLLPRKRSLTRYKPPSAHSRSLKMCHIISSIYTQCRHHRGSATVDPCDAGYDVSHSRCIAGRLTEQTVGITAPLLCPDCYRTREEEICQSFDEDRKGIKDKIIDAVHILERAEAAHAAMIFDGKDAEEKTLEVEWQNEVNDIAWFLDRYREWLKDVEEQRKGKLSQFRAAQGVWGDG